MPKSDIVPAYYVNQDECTGKPCRIMTRNEARLARDEDKGWFICNGTKFRLRNEAPAINTKPNQRPSINSCCGISKREMLANVGVPVTLDISDLEIFKAQEKVRVYPHIFDKLAVTARGSWSSTVAL